MTNYYNQPTEKELHFQSLQASEMLAKYATDVSIERGWDYERASRYVMHKHPDLAELAVKGYVDDQESHHYEYSSHEAGNLIAEKAKALMKSEQLPYETALKKVYADPANAEIMKCYAAAG